jgi:hypothetical protein
VSDKAKEILKRSRSLTAASIPKVMTVGERDASVALERSRMLLKADAEAKKRRGLFDSLPQGSGSGLDADTVDGLHASEIVAKAAKIVEHVGGGGLTSVDGKPGQLAEPQTPAVHGSEAHSVAFDHGSFLLGSFSKVEATSYNGDGTMAQCKIYDAAGALSYTLDFTYSSTVLQSVTIKNGSDVLLRTYTFTWDIDGKFEKTEMS